MDSGFASGGTRGGAREPRYTLVVARPKKKVQCWRSPCSLSAKVSSGRP